jgi:drug/metabolite transporter (DMT)-like permease
MSLFLTRDSLERRAVIGLLFAILGGSIVILASTSPGQALAAVGFLPVIIILIHMLLEGGWQIFLRKQNEKAIPLVAILGISYSVYAVIGMAALLIIRGPLELVTNFASLSIWSWLILLFLGVICSVAFNAIRTIYYERAGTTAVTAVSYFKKMLAIVVPLLILREVLSGEMLIGAGLIMIGVALAHRNKPRRQAARS